ncbi:GNAT family N-acetyltransferase [Flavobacterium sinopsychrotolerans]|jgi:ribosomal protein S18 acetylase RimI-like enzyme|uniref:Ribosomal protein S18 acetylase RimI n=1 Tax=Flavobacterium sinopsychrotolerans TaxID=604089 RepID=A0A1H8KW42_9FLAO|nr:GNAT family N-acetyltransferase [Flavobacterium sinopsychrotolerans]SEN97132.1 Ribosomal protein S18 acetylase RimI [Flavobacterium sinopsychrotolerans]
MNTIEIRKATVSDLETIQKISIQTFIETFAAVNTPENIANYIKDSLNTEQLTDELNNANSQFYLAYSDTEAVGYLKINFGDAQTESFNENALEVQRIYVLQNFHGKNIGQLLLDEVKKIAQITNVDSVWLGVWEENHRAIRFYTKNGFVVFDKHVFMMGNDEQTDLLMQLQIH